MEPVVVSATKTPVPVSHVTSAVEVITAETIKKRKIKSVTEALQLSQGLVILQSGGPGSTASARDEVSRRPGQSWKFSSTGKIRVRELPLKAGRANRFG